MNTLRRMIAAAMPLAVLGLAACGSSTTPFDPAALSQSTQDVITPMDSNRVVQSMDVLGDSMTTSGAPAMHSAVALATLPRSALRGGLAAWVARYSLLLQSPPARSIAQAQGFIIPDSLQGRTYIFDAATRHYVYAPDSAGAPSNGIRFLLYAVDPLAHRVQTTPLTEIGHVDVMDESTSATDLQLHVQAYDDALATVLIDYTATATGSITSGSASASGFVSDGTTEVEFDLTQTFSGGAVQANYKLSVPEKSISVVFDGSISILTQAVQMTATVKAGGNTDVIAVNGSVGGPVSGTITHNGTVVINISGTQDDPTFTDASGTAVTATEAQQLRRVALFITAVLNHVNALLAPAHVLLLGF